ncbi:hypothetical protein A6P39_034375 [Streptomyces sp. FXJ1.172]|uniref:hypothetical protein n=1 Tax=Streptomyces sp. FXJ1.172 TaxID=710705 RepID=UPI0007D001EB|nr:hypothetical protein [Streptomyces sp. FXJ1.172]WEO98722.1 hypothetical protein A6P39_034375 [Streptomyces sp. FXJ1.172]
MHRTTTTAALLVTVAVSALSGCVTVQRPAVPAPPQDTASALPSAPRPDGSAEPRVVQAPAEQALEMAGPPRNSEHPAPSASHHPVGAPPVANRPRAAAPARPHHRSEPHPRRSHTDVPGVSDPVPQAPDICALGRKYGGWRGDSPESEICEQTYSR